jgi:hypothetical protein
MFTRHVGVWHEGFTGQLMVFDSSFRAKRRLPGTGKPPLSMRRRYSAVHNVADFRFRKRVAAMNSANHLEVSQNG